MPYALILSQNVKKKNHNRHAWASTYDGSQGIVVKISFVDHFSVSASKLQQRTLADKVEEVREKRKQKGLINFFIRHNKTDTSEAETFFRNYENFTISNMINQVNGIVDIELD